MSEIPLDGFHILASLVSSSTHFPLDVCNNR